MKAGGEAPAGGRPVVRVIARMNVGGPALHTLHLTGGMAERYPTVLVSGGVANGEADMFPEAEARGLSVQRIPELGRSLRPWHDLVALAKLIRVMRRVRPTIVHTHTAKAGTLGRIAALVCRVPVRVHTFHGHVFHGYFGPWTTRAFIWVERALARTTTCIVTISDSQADDMVRRYRVSPAARTRVIPLGLELAPFHPAVSAGLGEEFRRQVEAGGRPVVSIVGRLVPIKNHELFFEMAALLVERGYRACFAVVGGGSEEARLRGRVAELGLEEHVRFVGWRSDLARVYAGSDVVVLTSRNEGTPVCLIEAMAAGRAVVSTDVGGVRDVLEDGRLGEVVPDGDAGALADAVARLLDDPERRARLGALGCEAAPRRFGVGRLLRDMECLYDELAGTRAASANLE